MDWHMDWSSAQDWHDLLTVIWAVAMFWLVVDIREATRAQNRLLGILAKDFRERFLPDVDE